VEEKRIFFKRTHDTIIVLDKFGRVRLAVDNGIVFDGKANDVRQKTEEYLRNSSDGLAPQIHLVNGTKLIDFSGITAPEHVAKAVENELANISEHEKVAAIIKIR
jgi:transcriptional antiterminator Rof (Rho-off)